MGEWGAATAGAVGSEGVIVAKPAYHTMWSCLPREECPTGRGARRVAEVRRDDVGLVAGAHQVQAYFSGALTRFELPLDLRHVTPFTVRVLRETRKIQFGQLTSYGAIAVRIGSLGSSRAVGGALGRNPVPIIIPCHRVISADGGIGGFTGGLRAKCVLLGLEGHEFTEPAGDCRLSGSVARA